MDLLTLPFQRCKDQINRSVKLHRTRFSSAPLKAPLTVILKHKEAAGAEVAVELDDNLIGGGGHALLDRVAAELADLGRSLVGPVPEEIEEGGGGLKNEI